MKQAIGMIPARWSSSRFPGKPLADILGKSLIQRTYENARRAKQLDQLIIATDDPRIEAHAKSFGAQTVMTSVACATGTARIAEALKQLGAEPDIVVNIQGDEPCVSPDTIDTLIHRLRETPGVVVTTPVTPLHDRKGIDSPNVVKCVFDKNYKALYFSRLPIPFAHPSTSSPAYFRHLGLYCFATPFLLEYARWGQTPLQASEDLEQLAILERGHPIHVAVVEESSLGVDTPEDLNKVKAFLCQKENIYL